MTQLPNLLQGPEPVETAELHFKLYCKLKIFETESKYEEGHCSVLAVSQYYGLIFVGNCTGFSVIQTKSLSPTIDHELFPKKDVILDSRPTHISVDYSQKILAVVCNSEQGSMLLFYNIHSFASKDVSPLKVTFISKLIQNTTAQVVDLTWQPNPDGSLMFCLSDGSVLAFSQGVKDGPLFTLPSSSQATCFCWSPKGKQIVVGSANGTISQYKPDLKAVKTLPPPVLFNGAAMVVSVLWISSYQFAVAYNDRANPESFPVITILNAAKNEPVNVINYDDITYSTTLFRNHQIYMAHQSVWNLIFVSSANSIEVAVLHSNDGSSWEQWLLGDASRAELPLNPDRQETFPLGWAFDFTSQESIPWGEGSLPPMPRLLLVSDEGLLCVFNIVNTAENASQLCAPPKENLDNSLFVISTKTAALPASVQLKPQSPKSLLGPPPVFGASKPTYTFENSSAFGGFGISKPQSPLSQAAPIIQQQHPEAAVQSQQQKQLQPVPTQVQQHQTHPINQIQQQLQPQISFTQSAPAFKVSTTQFGTPSTFSFGPNSASLLITKSVTPGNGNALKTNPATPVISLTVKPSTGQGDIFAAKNLAQSTLIKQPEAPVEKTITSKKPEEAVEATGKVEDSSGQGDSPGPETPELAAVDDSVYLSALQEEIEHFNSELQQLSTKMSNLNFSVGSEESKEKMKNSIDELTNFWVELKETTEGQKGEFHAVVMDLMEAFAWLEDAKSRNLQRKNPSYIELKKSEELDPFSARHMNEIRHLKYYIENQLKQLTSYVEKEWLDHQENYRNEVKNKMAVPPLEEVYKTMHYQLKILHKQKILIQELKEKVAAKKRKNKQNFLITVENSAPVKNEKDRVSELSKLAENLLQLKVDEEENFRHTGTWEMMKSQLNAISERSKKLTKEKQAALRDALSECDTVRIRPVKTNLESSAFLRSLALEKMAAKASKVKPPTKEFQTPIVQNETLQTKPGDKPIISIEVNRKKANEETKPKEKQTVAIEISKIVPQEKPLAVQPPLFQQEEKSPLVSLSGIVSNIGKKSEPKPAAAFVFGNSIFQKSEPGKDVAFGSLKLNQKQDEPKMFTFGVSKPAEPVFGKKEPIVFGAKPVFGLTNSTAVNTKPEVTKATPAPNVTVTLVMTSAATTFTFTAATTTPASLPKMNLLFSGKEQNSSFGTSTTGSLFSVPSATTQTSASSIFAPSMMIFGGNKTTTSLFTAPKTTSEVSSQSSFTFAQPAEHNSGTVTKANAVKTNSETEVKVNEPVKKAEIPSEKSKESPLIFGSPLTPTKTVPENTVTTSTPPNVTVSTVSTPQTSVSTINVFAKPVATTAVLTETSTTAADSVSSSTTTKTTAIISTTTTSTSTSTTTTTTTTTATATTIATTTTITTTTTTTTTTITTTPTTSATSTITTTTTTSVFSFTPAVTPVAFRQTPSTTAPAIATTASPFGTPTTTTSVFGQVSSTTPTNIFGGSTTGTPTSNIFGGSTSTKPIFGQAATPTTTTESIFGNSTPTTLGQASSPTTFGQKPDSVAQTANLFGQLLSDSNRSVFGTSSPTPTTTAGIFSTPKNFFGGAASTTTPTTSLFGTTSSSVFPQTTSIFGQPTTSPSIFGQSKTSVPGTFFGQNICSPFAGGTSVTSNQSTFKNSGFSKPIFGQSTFGQTTNNTSIFGGSSSGSLFCGSSSTTSSIAFQTPTTSTTFGSTSHGPFSGGNSSFGESSFGSTSNTFQKPLGGFGSPPVFGGGPAFGGSPTFGGSPSFGSLPTFGSMSQATFGQSVGSTTFENLANQNTVGFGNLAQQSQSQGFGGGFGSSFESKPAFGGNSFSSWRSK